MNIRAEYYNDEFCIEVGWLVESGIITDCQRRHATNRNEFNVIRRACRNTPALATWKSLRKHYRDAIIAQIGYDPAARAPMSHLMKFYEVDTKARHYYTNSGESVRKKAVEYTVNASMMNAMIKREQELRLERGRTGRTRGLWDIVMEEVKLARAETGHTLRDGDRRLRQRYMAYKRTHDYRVLISGRHGNDNARKVSVQIDALLQSLYIMADIPFCSTIKERYDAFIYGQIQVYDHKTGEVFNPQDYYRNGRPISLSESTIKNYLMAPGNRMLTAVERLGRFTYNNVMRPYNRRNRPQFAFSKISIDDRSLPRKSISGWVNSYVAVDLGSECWVGAAYKAGKPDTELVWHCLRNMYRLIDAHGLPMPGEVEVEHHLTGTMLSELQALFPYVRLCLPGNSREKGAEHMINQKKYTTEKKTQVGVGRWSNRSEGKSVPRVKVAGEFEEREYSIEQLIREDILATARHNHSLHSKQKKYPGMTRWEVLMHNINPSLRPLGRHVALRYIGEHTKTSIRNNDYVRVQHADYWIDNTIDVIGMLSPRNYEVDAYYLPDEHGNINEVHIYQNDIYLCSCVKAERYNEAQIERIERDEEIRVMQAKRQERFDRNVREGRKAKVTPLGILTMDEVGAVEQAEPRILRETPHTGREERGDEDVFEYALMYNGSYMQEKALNDM